MPVPAVLAASKFRHDEIAEFVMTNFFLHVLRYESGRLARMHWTAHCSTSHLIQADDLP
jgi:hypothetical protein